MRRELYRAMPARGNARGRSGPSALVLVAWSGILGLRRVVTTLTIRSQLTQRGYSPGDRSRSFRFGLAIIVAVLSALATLIASGPVQAGPLPRPLGA